MRYLVLNTRAKGQSQDFTTLLNQAGFDVLEIPATEISQIESGGEIISTLLSFDEEDLVVFTSINAVIFAVQDQIIKDLLTKCRVAAVGEKTAKILIQNGISVHLQSNEGSAEDLGDIISCSIPKKLLYISGIPNTGALRRKLSNRVQFLEVPIYRSFASSKLRQLLVDNESRLNEVDYLTFLSVEAIRAIDECAELLGYSLRDKTCVVISNRVAKEARLLGYQDVIVSQARSSEGIVSELLSSSRPSG